MGSRPRVPLCDPRCELPQMEEIRILIVDDHAVVRDGLAAVLGREKDFVIVGEAADGMEAVEKASECDPGVILMDLRMPRMNGVEAMRRIHAQNPEVQLLVLTTFDSDEYIFDAIEAGARGYLLKDASRAELFEAVRAAHRGESLIEPAVAAKVLERLVRLSHEGAPATKHTDSKFEPSEAQTHAPEGTVTILFTDVTDSSEMTERLGDTRAQELIQDHNAIVRKQIKGHGGFEVKFQGDGFMVAFSSARRGLQFAIALQTDLAEYNRTHADEPIRVRIGLHTGEAIRRDEDFFGRNVILASRIASQATGEEILVSSLLKALVDSSGEFEFGEPRTVSLKGLAGPHQVFDVKWR